MSADVNIILDAEDRATAKLRAAAAQMEATGKQIKTTGDATKKSTELFGRLAGMLGGSEIANAASQFAGLTERVSGFSDVLKAGNAGALAFKAGLVGIVGVIAFQVGKAIGDVIFQTKRWTEELEKANQKAEKLNAELLKLSGVRFSDARAEIELITNVDEQRAAYEQFLEQLNTDIGGMENNIRALEKQLDETFNDPSSWEAWTTSSKEAEEATRRAIEPERERLKQLTEQRNEIMKLLNAESELEQKREQIRQQQEQDKLAEQSQAYIANLRTEIALLGAKGEELNKLIAAQNTTGGDDAALAAELLAQRDAIKAEQMKQAEADKTIESLQQQAELLRLGREEYERQQQLAAATNDEERNRIATLQQEIATREELAAIDKEIKDAEKQAGGGTATTGITATQGRLITRGPSQDVQAKQLQAQEKSLEELKQMKGYLEEQVRNIGEQLNLVLVGGGI
jgi:phage shock protein A